LFQVILIRDDSMLRISFFKTQVIEEYEDMGIRG
jgi:hypothetical protein